MQSVFGGMVGVSRFYREGHGGGQHDPSAVTVEQVMDVFSGLPSFYRHRFVPSGMESPEK